jgi:hypothetical protein
LRVAQLGNFLLGCLSGTTGLLAFRVLNNVWIPLGFLVAYGCVQVLSNPATDCLFAQLSGGKAQAREHAIRIRDVVRYSLGVVFALLFIALSVVLGSGSDNVPRQVAGTALLFDAFTFFAVLWALRPVQAQARMEAEDRFRPIKAFTDAWAEEGACPLLLCVLMVWSFTYVSIAFFYGFISDITFPGPAEWNTVLQQVTFWLAFFAACLGGIIGASRWRISRSNLFWCYVLTCVVEMSYALMGWNFILSVAVALIADFFSIWLFAACEGILLHTVQGMKENASISALANQIKSGVSPFVGVGITALARFSGSPRCVLCASYLLCLLVVLAVFALRGKQIEVALRRAKLDGNEKLTM